MSLRDRGNILGVGVHALDLSRARDLVMERARTGRGYVCFCDVNSLSCARRDPAHLAALNNAFLTTPDGMPVVWMMRRTGHRDVTRVYGPDLLLEICAASTGTELTHYFYGGGEGTAPALAAELQKRFPDLRIVGMDTPPFGEPDAAQASALAQRTAALRPDFIWIGLSTPKQEKLMALTAPLIQHGVMLGVGAAFDFLSGRVRQAPRWMQRSGLEWLFRLASEPRRLAPRYFRNNPLFLVRAFAQLTGLKRYSEPARSGDITRR